jgi:hypothetical protein
MIAKIEVERFSLTSSRPFDEVLAAIKGLQFGALGQRDDAEEKDLRRRLEAIAPGRFSTAAE